MFVFNCQGVEEFKGDLRLFNKTQAVEEWPAETVSQFFCSQFSLMNGQSISFPEEGAAFSAAEFNGKELITLEIKQLLATCSLLSDKDRLTHLKEVIEILRKSSSLNIAQTPCLNSNPPVPKAEPLSNRPQRSRKLQTELPIKPLGRQTIHRNGASKSKPIVNCSNKNRLIEYFRHARNLIPIKEWTDNEVENFFSRQFRVNEAYYLSIAL